MFDTDLAHITAEVSSHWRGGGGRELCLDPKTYTNHLLKRVFHENDLKTMIKAHSRL